MPPRKKAATTVNTTTTTSNTTTTTTTTSSFVTSPPPPLETATLQRRLDTGVVVAGGARGSLTRCVSRYQEFLAQLSSTSPDADSIEQAKQALERELQLHQVEFQKSLLALQVAARQCEEMEVHFKTLQPQIFACQQEIRSLHQQEERSKRVRHNQQEYEALAKMANHRPPTAVLQQQLAALQCQKEQLQQQLQVQQKEMEIRGKQFRLLVQCMLDLKASVVVDNVNEKDEEDEEEEGEQQEEDNEEEEEEGIVAMDTS